MTAKPTPAQIRAIRSVDPEVGSINATSAVFRRVVEAGWVRTEIRPNPTRAVAIVTDAGRAVIEEAAK